MTCSTIHLRISFFLFCMLLISSPLWAVTRFVSTSGSDSSNVCTSGGNPCRTVGHAVAVASSGDEIHLLGGLYKESDIVIDKNLDIWGFSGATISALEKGRHFFVEDTVGYFGVHTLDLTEGNGNGAPISSSGGSIYIEGNSSVLINHADFIKNTASLGGAIYCSSNCRLTTLEHSKFESNSALGGGAIAALNLGNGFLQLIETKFLDNRAQANISGGAVHAVLGNLIVTDSKFSENSSVWNGGAIFSLNSKVRVFRTEFSFNTADRDKDDSGSGGAIYFTQSGSTTGVFGFFSNNTFYKNKSYEGGAFYLSGVPDVVRFSNNTFARNSSTSSLGETLTVSASGVDLVLRNNIFQDYSGATCDIASGSFPSSGFHNFFNDASCDPGSIPNFNLGPISGISSSLASNGGPNDTVKIFSNSNARDAGANDCPNAGNGAPLPRDQRSYSRSDGHCDVGAFEFQ